MSVKWGTLQNIVITFILKYPFADIIIVEPNINIFNKIAIFIQYLSDNTVIIGMDDNLKKWKRIYHFTFINYKRKRKEIMFFEHP